MTLKKPLPPDKLKISPRFVRAAKAAYGERDLTTPKPMMQFPWRKKKVVTIPK